MTAAYLVGIDVGSQSAKVVVHDAAGTVVAEGRAPLRPPLTPYPGAVEHPDDDLWQALVSACRTATDALGKDRDAVVGVGLCGVRCCRAMLGEDGSLVGPVLSWMDERLSRPYRHTDERVARVSAASGHLTHRLTGELRDSVASYDDRWPVDPEAWGWLGDAALPPFGIARGQLMELVLPGQVLGTVTVAAAAVTGLPVGVPVVATANDKAVEALGAGLRSPDDLLVSLGTYVAAMTVGAELRTGGSSFWTNLSAVPGEYLYESAGIRRGMWTVSWLRELLGGSGLDLADLEAGARDVPPGSDGLLTLLDWLPPPDQPWRRGAFVGLDARHGPFHLHRSVLEALALTMQRHAENLTTELGATPRRVVLSGGGSASDLMLQVVADVFDLPVTRGSAPSAAALGAAVSAAVAVGLHPSVEAAVDAMVHAGAGCEPGGAGRATYAGMRGLHQQLCGALEPVLRQTHGLS